MKINFSTFSIADTIDYLVIFKACQLVWKILLIKLFVSKIRRWVKNLIGFKVQVMIPYLLLMTFPNEIKALQHIWKKWGAKGTRLKNEFLLVKFLKSFLDIQ